MPCDGLVGGGWRVRTLLGGVLPHLAVEGARAREVPAIRDSQPQANTPERSRLDLTSSRDTRLGSAPQNKDGNDQRGWTESDQVRSGTISVVDLGLCARDGAGPLLLHDAQDVDATRQRPCIAIIHTHSDTLIHSHGRKSQPHNQVRRNRSDGGD